MDRVSASGPSPSGSTSRTTAASAAQISTVSGANASSASRDEPKSAVWTASTSARSAPLGTARLSASSSGLGKTIGETRDKYCFRTRLPPRGQARTTGRSGRIGRRGAGRAAGRHDRRDQWAYRFHRRSDVFASSAGVLRSSRACASRSRSRCWSSCSSSSASPRGPRCSASSAFRAARPTRARRLLGADAGPSERAPGALLPLLAAAHRAAREALCTP